MNTIKFGRNDTGVEFIFADFMLLEFALNVALGIEPEVGEVKRCDTSELKSLLQKVKLVIDGEPTNDE